jgi:LuxR family transcriptional regulator, maltose regulon positive regulatory protein
VGIVKVTKPPGLHRFVGATGGSPALSRPPALDSNSTEGLKGILKDFVRRNLFVQESYEPGRSWTFRFHQLFREFLLARFQETVPELEKADLYRRAAPLFQERGNPEEAVQLFLRANDLAAAAGIIRQIGLGLAEKSR